MIHFLSVFFLFFLAEKKRDFDEKTEIAVSCMMKKTHLFLKKKVFKKKSISAQIWGY